MTNGKQKGSSYERHVAKLFEKWSGMSLRRTPMSGGWARQNPRASGDVVAIENDDFPFCIECKKNESFSWETALHGKGPLFDWWTQNIKACPDNKIPIVIFSRNRYDDWIMSREIGLIDSKKYLFSVIVKVCNDNYGDMYVCLLKEFLSAFDMKYFIGNTY